MKDTHYKIGELAKKAQVSVESLRYYEAEGLISAKMRTESGYRLYGEQELQQLYFILHAKKVGFSLKEIAKLLGLQVNKEAHTCEEVKSYTGDKIAELEAKIRDLQKMKQALTGLYQACCGGPESAQNCTILQTLEDPEYFKIERA
ncbi:MAG: Zn(2+)-responsive transcriptional regulator [Kangiellaceae bacterium]|nr:Zn(2+)-responsive transcriptional regulator [Kangiellaceae bacterium]MCW9001024.1 Zn(2+)-responsive transcriptional regulator [Kangiellaceae bacterium]